MSSCRIVFLGTPDFAVPALHELVAAPDLKVVGVVTQPDRPAGRGQKIEIPPVKQAALQANIPMIQPEKVREPAAMEQIIAWEPDYLVVVAFGQILRQNLLAIPRIAPINVHASLLPRWRGASPIQAAIRAGDNFTGVTTMVMEAGLDSGPILLQDSILISPDETGQSLHDKLAPLGAMLLVHTLRWLYSGSIVPHPQPTDPALISTAPIIKKEDGLIQWSDTAAAIDRHVRAFTPWPGTYTYWNNQRLKIISGYPIAAKWNVPPGQVADTRGADLAQAAPFVIGTGRGVYVPTRLQLAGRQVTDATSFLNGAPDFFSSTLG